MTGVIAEHRQLAFCLGLPEQWPIYQMTVQGLDEVLRVICGDFTKPLKRTTLVKAVIHIERNNLQSTSMEGTYLRQQGHALR